MLALQSDDIEGVFGNPADWRTSEAIAEREERQAAARAAKPRETRFGRISFGELRTRKAKAPDFVIDDWMVAKEVSFFAGESEAGKTFLAIDTALRTSLGWPVFGRRTKAGLVIYQIGESGDSLTDLRIPAWVRHFGADLPERVPFEILTSKVNLWTSETGAKDGALALLDTIRGIMAEYPDIPLASLYIDTWSKAFAGGNEIDGKDVAKVIGNAEMIARETGAHVAIIHHFPKGGTTLRGHGSMKADVNSVAMVSMDANTKIRTIRFDKLKDGEKGTMQFELKQIILGEREDGKPITSCVVLPVGEKDRLRAQVASGAVGVTPGENAFLRAFFASLDKDGIIPPPGFECPADAKLVDYEAVRSTFYEMSPPQDIAADLDDEQRELSRRRHKDATRKALKRASDDLARKLVIGVRLWQPTPDAPETYFAWWKGRPVRGFPRTYPPAPKEEARLPDDVDLSEVTF